MDTSNKATGTIEATLRVKPGTRWRTKTKTRCSPARLKVRIELQLGNVANSSDSTTSSGSPIVVVLSNTWLTI